MVAKISGNNIKLQTDMLKGATLAEDFYAGLRYWRKLAQTPDGPAALVYGGDRTVQRSGVITYSWADL